MSSNNSRSNNSRSTSSSKVIRQSNIKFPVIKIKLILANKDVKNIENTKNVKLLLAQLSNKRNVSYKQNNNEFNIIANNCKITRLVVNNILETLFNILKRLRNVIGFHYYIIMNRSKIHSFKCLNKKCNISREKINKFMSFINN